MGGWNIIYNLINFAILAAALFLVGKKIVPKIFGGRRDQITESLEKSGQAAENAKETPAKIQAANAAGEKEREEILAAARATAEANRREAEEADRQAAAKLMGDAAQEEKGLRRALQSELSGKAAEEITAAAAELLRQPEQAGARDRLSRSFVEYMEKEQDMSHKFDFNEKMPLIYQLENENTKMLITYLVSKYIK